MADVKILEWTLAFMRLLIQSAGRPVPFSAIREQYPELNRNTLKNRIDMLCLAQWARQSEHGYALHPAFILLLRAAQRSAVESLGELSAEMKLLAG